MDESRKEWLEFTKTAVICAMRPYQPNLDNLHVADEPLKDNLGFEYHAVTGIVFDGPAPPFRLDWFRFYAPDDKYPDLYALLYKCHIGAKNVPAESYAIQHVGKSSIFLGGVGLPLETPVCDLGHDLRLECLESLAPDGERATVLYLSL